MNRRKAKKMIRKYLKKDRDCNVKFSNFGDKNLIATYWQYCYKDYVGYWGFAFFKVSKSGLINRIDTDEAMIDFTENKYSKYPESKQAKRIKKIKEQLQFEKDYPRVARTMEQITADEVDGIETVYYTVSQIIDKFQDDSDALLNSMLIR